MKVELKKHPDLDFFVGFIGGSEIPTKQDKFKPLQGYEIQLVEDDETEKRLDEYDLYKEKREKLYSRI